MKGFSGADHKGYTSEQGGRSKAEEDYKSRTRDAPSRPVGADSQSRIAVRSTKLSAAGQPPFAKVHTSNSTRKKQRPASWEDGLNTPCKHPRLGHFQQTGLYHATDASVIGYAHGSPTSSSCDSDTSTEESKNSSSSDGEEIKSRTLPCASSHHSTSSTEESSSSSDGHAEHIALPLRSFSSNTDDCCGMPSRDFQKVNPWTSRKDKCIDRKEPDPNSTQESLPLNTTLPHGISDNSLKHSRSKRVRRKQALHAKIKTKNLDEGLASSNYGENEYPDDLFPLIIGDESSVGAALALQESEYSTAGAEEKEPALSTEQQHIIDTTMQGRNVFFTGSAGTGKSTTLKHLIRKLRDDETNVSIIAPTGQAALAVGGTTDHTYAGWWGPNTFRRPVKELEVLAHRKRIWKRLKGTRVLIIDEISMVENHRFERLNRIMMSARNDHRAFGGVQLIVTGDPCQLPPVRPFQSCIDCGAQLYFNCRDDHHECSECDQKFADIDKWAFRSEAWTRCEFVHISLTEIHRQSDPEFIRILETLRLGHPLSVEQEHLLLDHEVETTDAVKLRPTRGEVAAINDAAFRQLKGPIVHYTSFDDFEPRSEDPPDMSDRAYDGSLVALAEHSFLGQVQLKADTLVVLLANIDFQNRLVNGSQGIVVGFKDHDITEMPAQSGEYAERKQSLIDGFTENLAVKKWPIVRFTNGVTRTIHPICRIQEVGYEKPYSLLSRTQIPLIQAWALTIHKSQGMTLDKVIVNLSKVFEEGQAYVALSRARNLRGLRVEALADRQIAANAEVKAFLRKEFPIGRT